MILKEVSLIDRSEYNQFVAAQPTGSFLQSWEWGQWQENLERKIYRYWILDEQENKIGSVQFVKMPLPFGKYYLYAPYGPVVSNQWTVDSGQWFQVLQNKFSDAVFVRIEPKIPSLPTTHYPLLTKSQNIQPAKTLVIDLNKSEDEILAGMHHKTRYNIKVAKKHGVDVQDEFVLTVGKGLFVQEAVELIKLTSARQGYTAQSKSYFEDLINFFALTNKTANLKLHIYKAIYNKQLLASAIIIDFGDTRTYLFGGSADENKNVMAPYSLHFKAMLDAKVQGLKSYDFWGIETSSGETPGFVRFKLGFGGIEKKYSGSYDIVTSPNLYQAYSLVRKVNKAIKKITS